MGGQEIASNGLVDGMIDGQNVCPEGCFLSLSIRRFDRRDDCPWCGSMLERVEEGSDR